MARWFKRKGSPHWLARKDVLPGARIAAQVIAAIRTQDTLDMLAIIRAKRARQVRMRDARKKFLGVDTLRRTLPRDSDSQPQALHRGLI